MGWRRRSVRSCRGAQLDPNFERGSTRLRNARGEYKMRLAVGDGTYEIHGTNNPVAVGLAVIHGCIRMYLEDVAALFASVPVGTKVWLINEPVKIAYVDGKLLLEVHLPVDGEGQLAQVEPEVMSQKLRAALAQNTAAIHWEFARKALETATGGADCCGFASASRADGRVQCSVNARGRSFFLPTRRNAMKWNTTKFFRTSPMALLGDRRGIQNVENQKFASCKAIL
jgi:hypothetical protein